MLKKALCYVLLILIAEEFTLTRGNDAEIGDKLLQLVELGKHFPSLGRNLTKIIINLSYEGDVFYPKMKTVGEKLKDGTVDVKLKKSTAEEIIKFSNDSNSVMEELQKLTGGGFKLTEAFFHIANELEKN